MRDAGSGVAASGVWRDGKRLVMRRGVALPDRCVKCNASADGYRLQCKFEWFVRYGPVAELACLFLLGPWAIWLRKERRIDIVQVGLCTRHRHRRRRLMRACWMVGAFALSLALLAVAISVADVPRWIATREPAGWMLGVAFGLLILAILIECTVRSPVAVGQRDNYCVWLNGVHLDYLADLPELPDESSVPISRVHS